MLCIIIDSDLVDRLLLLFDLFYLSCSFSLFCDLVFLEAWNIRSDKLHWIYFEGNFMCAWYNDVEFASD